MELLCSTWRHPNLRLVSLFPWWPASCPAWQPPTAIVGQQDYQPNHQPNPLPSALFLPRKVARPHGTSAGSTRTPRRPPVTCTVSPAALTPRGPPAPTLPSLSACPHETGSEQTYPIGRLDLTTLPSALILPRALCLGWRPARTGRALFVPPGFPCPPPSQPPNLCLCCPNSHPRFSFEACWVLS